MPRCWLALALLCGAGPSAAYLARVQGAAPAAPAPVPTPGAASSRPAVLREPAGLEGVPAALAALAGACFSLDSTPAHRYIYEFCPFRNVTQREHPASYNSFFGLLGTWEGWEQQSAQQQQQQQQLVGLYTDGTECGVAKQRRLAKVQWLCSSGGAYVLKGVVEPRQCEYKLLFASPEACGLVLPPSPSAAPAAPEAAPAQTPAPAPPARAPSASASPRSSSGPSAAAAAAVAAPPAAAAASAAALEADPAAASVAALDPGAALLAVLQELRDARKELGSLKEFLKGKEGHLPTERNQRSSPASPNEASQ